MYAVCLMSHHNSSLLSTLCIASPAPTPQCGAFLSWVWPWSMPSPSPESSSFRSWRRAIWSMHSPFSSRLQLARCSPLPSCSFCQRFDIYARPCTHTHTHTRNHFFFLVFSSFGSISLSAAAVIASFLRLSLALTVKKTFQFLFFTPPFCISWWLYWVVHCFSPSFLPLSGSRFFSFPRKGSCGFLLHKKIQNWNWTNELHWDWGQQSAVLTGARRPP